MPSSSARGSAARSPEAHVGGPPTAIPLRRGAGGCWASFAHLGHSPHPGGYPPDHTVGWLPLVCTHWVISTDGLLAPSLPMHEDTVGANPHKECGGGETKCKCKNEPS